MMVKFKFLKQINIIKIMKNMCMINFKNYNLKLKKITCATFEERGDKEIKSLSNESIIIFFPQGYLISLLLGKKINPFCAKLDLP